MNKKFDRGYCVNRNLPIIAKLSYSRDSCDSGGLIQEGIHADYKNVNTQWMPLTVSCKKKHNREYIAGDSQKGLVPLHELLKASDQGFWQARATQDSAYPLP